VPRKLIIDARWLYTGLGAYTGQLICALHELAELPFGLVTLPEHRDKLAAYSREIVLSNARLYSAREQIDIPRAARDYEVLHVPHYNVPLFRRGTLLVSIHDLNHLLGPTMSSSLKSRFYARPMLLWAAKRADHIFTQSEYSKDKIVEHLGAKTERITVTYTGVPPHIYAEPREASRMLVNRAYGFSGPYILFVGNLKPHKNVAGLLKTFAILRQRRKIDQKLLIIGDDPLLRPVLMREASNLGLRSSAVFAGSVSDEQVRAAYSGADLTVVPSFEEGLGLPILESMACGTPVSCSNTASLPEAAGNAAEYFSPSDPESIASACENVLLSSERWKDLQQRGFTQAAKFHWRECAARHIPVYRSFLAVS
jgi:glycosyltransferase involved in cell wall biosynthesis